VRIHGGRDCPVAVFVNTSSSMEGDDEDGLILCLDCVLSSRRSMLYWRPAWRGGPGPGWRDGDLSPVSSLSEAVCAAAVVVSGRRLTRPQLESVLSVLADPAALHAALSVMES
jgi:hypothetical protein